MPRKKVPVPVPEGHAYCFGCKRVLPLSAYYVDRHKPSGHASRCRDCAKATADHAIKIRAELAEWYARPTPPTPVPADYAPEVLFHGGTPPDYERIDRFRRMHR